MHSCLRSRLNWICSTGLCSKSAKVVLLSVSTWRTGLRMPAYAFQSDDLIHYLLQARGSWDSRVPGSSLLAW